MVELRKENLNKLNLESLFDLCKETSLIEFRKNINVVIDTLGNIDILNKVYAYYDEILDSYNDNTGLFKDYELLLQEIRKYGFIKNRNRNDYLIDKKLCYNFDNEFINNPQGYLQKLTSKKISEIVVDYLFSDNIYNVFINLLEIIRYHNNNGLNIISPEIMTFYKKIYFIDSIANKEKIKLLKIFKDSKIDAMYYFHLDLLKKDSYKRINNDIVKVFSKGINDFRNKEGYLLARSLYEPWNMETTNKRDSYFLIDLNNPKLFPGEFIYGYNHLDIRKTIHILDKDAASCDMDLFNTTNYVNRLMNAKELTRGKINEIQILNTKKGNKYISCKPDYLIAVEKATDKIVNESIRLDIPVVIVKQATKDNYQEENDPIKITYTSDLSLEDERNKRR